MVIGHGCQWNVQPSPAAKIGKTLGQGTGSTGIEGKLVLNRDNHPIFETTNCLQGAYVM